MFICSRWLNDDARRSLDSIQRSHSRPKLQRPYANDHNTDSNGASHSISAFSDAASVPDRRIVTMLAEQCEQSTEFLEHNWAGGAFEVRFKIRGNSRNEVILLVLSYIPTDELHFVHLGGRGIKRTHSFVLKDISERVMPTHPA